MLSGESPYYKVVKLENGDYADKANGTMIFHMSDGVLISIEETSYSSTNPFADHNGTYEPPKDNSKLKPLLIAAGITAATVGTIHTVKAIKNYKAEKAAAAEAAKLAEMPMVRMGDSGDAVMTLQTELNAQGYNCGEADGVFGQNTLNAVIAFQTAKGLTADGVVGAQTWGALL